MADHPLAARVLSGHEPDVIDRLLDLPSLQQLTDEVAVGIALAQEAGEIRADVDARTIAEGLESAPEAFTGLLKGRNFGKQLVKLV